MTLSALLTQEPATIKSNLVHPQGRDTFWRFYFGSVPAGSTWKTIFLR